MKNDNQNDLTELRILKDKSLKEYETEKELLENNEKLKLKKINEIKEKEKELEAKNNKLQEQTIEIEAVEGVINSQKVSFQEYEKMQQTKQITDNQISVLQEKKCEVEEKLGVFTNSGEEMAFQLIERLKVIKSLIEKVSNNSSDNERFFNLDLDSYLQAIQNNNLDSEKMRNNLSSVEEKIQELVQSRILEIRIKEDETFKVKSELLILQDKRSELERVLNNKEHESEQLRKTIEEEKEKFKKVTQQNK